MNLAFAGLRRLMAPSGVIALTVPFVFPLDMEPHDFRRLTPRAVARLVSSLESASLSRRVAINSHSSLSNGVVLRAG